MDTVAPEPKTLSSRSIKSPPVVPAPNPRQPSPPNLATRGSQATTSASTKQQVLTKQPAPNQQLSVLELSSAIKQQTLPLKRQQRQPAPSSQQLASKKQSVTKQQQPVLKQQQPTAPPPPPQQSQKFEQILNEESTDVSVLPSKTASTTSTTEAKPNYGIKTFAEIMAEKRAKKAAEEAASSGATTTIIPEPQQKSTSNGDAKVVSETSRSSKLSEPKKSLTRPSVHPTNVAKVINGNSQKGTIAERNDTKAVANQTNTLGATNPSQKRTANTAVLPATVKLSQKKQKLDGTNPVDSREQSELKSGAVVNSISTTTSSSAKRSRPQEAEHDLLVDASATSNKRAKPIPPPFSTPAAPPSPVTVTTFALTTSTNKKTEQEEPITPLLSADLYGEFGVLDEADLAELNAIAPEELADFDLEAAKLELGI